MKKFLYEVLILLCTDLFLKIIICLDRGLLLSILGNTCVTLSAAFQMVCWPKPVLETALAALNEFKGDKVEFKNEYVIFFMRNLR